MKRDDISPRLVEQNRRSIQALISSVAEKAPDAIAIAGVHQPPLTYAGLENHLVKLAMALNALGVRRNDRVAIVLPNGPEMATAFLGVAACATSAPINPASSPSEFEFYLSDLEAKAVITQKGIDSPVNRIAQSQHIPVVEISVEAREPAGASIRGLTPPARLKRRFSSGGRREVRQSAPHSSRLLCGGCR